MDVKTMMKIERSFCGSRYCTDNTCPFHDGVYLCHIQPRPINRCEDAILKWIDRNGIDPVTKRALMREGVYDEFVKYFSDVEWV